MVAPRNESGSNNRLAVSGEGTFPPPTPSPRPKTVCIQYPGGFITYYNIEDVWVTWKE